MANAAEEGVPDPSPQKGVSKRGKGKTKGAAARSGNVGEQQSQLQHQPADSPHQNGDSPLARRDSGAASEQGMLPDSWEAIAEDVGDAEAAPDFTAGMGYKVTFKHLGCTHDDICLWCSEALRKV